MYYMKIRQYTQVSELWDELRGEYNVVIEREGNFPKLITLAGEQQYKAPEYLGGSTLLSEALARKLILGETI